MRAFGEIGAMASDDVTSDRTQSDSTQRAADLGSDVPRTNREADLASPSLTRVLGIYLIVLGTGLVYLTAVVWPPDFEVAAKAVGQEKTAKDVASPIVFVKRRLPPAKPAALQQTTPAARPNSPAQQPASGTGAVSGQTTGEVAVCQLNVSYDKRLLLLVMVVGALGSFIHVVSSFADFVGNRRFIRSWIWWYLLRPYVGVPLAVLFYFVIRAGFLSSGVSAGEVNRFGIAAIAGLVGMFSVKATDKLKELFDTFFKTETQRKDALGNPVPVVQSIQPSKETSGKEFIDVLVTGSNFIGTSMVKVGKVGRDTEFRSSTELSVKLLAQDIARAGSVSLTVTNPPPGGGVSDPIVLELENPTPLISTVEASADGSKLKIVGSGFSPDSTVSVNGVAKSAADTIFVNSMELSVSHPIDPATEKVDIEVSNPKPGGGTSGKGSFPLKPK
jgi:hypothetical protein